MIRKKFGKSVIAVMLSLGLMFSGSAETMMPIGTTVMVEAATNKLTLSVSNKNIYVGASAKLNAKTTKGAKLTYSSSNKGIVTVDKKGNIKARKAGTAKITVTAKKSKCKTVKKTITVKVSKKNQKITASNVSVYYKKGRSLGAKAKTGLTYKSSNSAVVSVNSKGYIVGKKSVLQKFILQPKNLVHIKKQPRRLLSKL